MCCVVHKMEALNVYPFQGISSLLRGEFEVISAIGIKKKKSAVLTGSVFFAVMTVLYLMPFSMSGVVAYIKLA